MAAVLVREQAFLQPGQEDHVELQPLGRVDGHQLHRVGAGVGLVVAGLQRGVGEELGQQRVPARRGRLAGAGPAPASALEVGARR